MPDQSIQPPLPPHLRPKLGRNVLSCATIVFAVLLVLGAAFAFALAKSGLVAVPVFSRFYAGLHPTRIVSAAPMSVADFQKLLETRLRSQLVAEKKPPFEVPMSEKELTAVMQDAILRGLDGQSWTVSSTQVVILPTDMEFSSRFTRGIFHLDIVARFALKVHDGGVGFEPTAIRIGDYSLPPSIAYQAVTYLFSRDLGTFYLRFADMRLQDVRLKDGEATLVVTTGMTEP